jgi:hypothetical protein
MTASAATAPRPPHVVVLGLYDSQVAIIRSEFPGLRIDSPNRDNIGEIRAAQRNADAVFAFLKFISHNASGAVDRAKLRVVSGLNDLRQKLAEIAAGAAFASNVLPFRTEPLADMSAPLVDYSSGSLLFFHRPPNIEAHVFAQNVQSARQHYRERYGVETTQDIRGGRAEVFVTKGVDPSRLINGRPPMPDAVPDDFSFRLPNLQERAQAFWQETYLESFRAKPYAPSADHAHIASVAVGAWLMICGGE